MPTLVELKNMCKHKGIKGYSKLNKKQLEKLVKKAQKKKAPKKKAPKKKAPKKKVTKGGFSQIKLNTKYIDKVIVNTFAIPMLAKKGFNIGIEILPNPNNPSPGFPVWKGIAKLTQFLFKQEYISKFQSYVNSSLTPMDCFINACQLVGVLDTLNANILRISCAGQKGFSLDAMEKIFTLKSASLSGTVLSSSDEGMDPDRDTTMKKNTVQYYNFTDLNNLGGGIELFANTLKDNLETDHAAFCGWAQSSGAHVFIIRKDFDGDLWYLDPQQTGSPCILDNNKVCQNLLRNGETQDRRYFILYNTPIEKPIPINIIKDLGFDLSSGRSVHAQGTVFTQ